MYSALRFRKPLERALPLYVKILFAFAGAFFAVSLLSPERFGWLVARIIMFCFAGIVYIYSLLILPFWPLLLVAALVASAACSILKSNTLNFFRIRLILPGTFFSLVGAAGGLLGGTTAALAAAALLFINFVVSPLYGLVIIAFFSLAFRFLNKRSWRSEILRDIVFIFLPPTLLSFANIPLFWNRYAIAVLVVAIILLLFWRERAKRKSKGFHRRAASFLLVACALFLFNGLAGLSAGWNYKPVEEVLRSPGIELLTKPVKHYSCLLSPDGEALFATNGDGRSVSRIPLDGGKAISRPTEGRPNWLALIPSRNRLAVINGDSFSKAVDVVLFDAKNLKKIRTAVIRYSLYGIYYSEKKDLLYVHTLVGIPYLMALDPETLAVVRRRRLPYRMSFLFRLRGDEELGRLYLPDFSYNGTLHVADMTTLRTIKSVRLGTSLTDVAVVPEQNRLYVAAPMMSRIIVLRRSDLKKIGEIRAGMNVRAVAVDPRSGRLFAGNSRDGTLEIYDTGSGKKLRAIPTAREIRSIEIGEDGDVVYVASGSGVFRVDLRESGEQGQE
ncbi:MAG: WD40 repeat domain-containing protein [bacterium]